MKQTKRRSNRNPYDNAQKISEISPRISTSSSLTARKGSIFKIQPRISIFLHNDELYIYTNFNQKPKFEVEFKRQNQTNAGYEARIR